MYKWTILFCLISQIIFGQTLGNGIYKGEIYPGLTCYLTYNSKTIDIEWYYLSNGVAYSHDPKITLSLTSKENSRRQVFESPKDDIKVVKEKNYFSVINKGLREIQAFPFKDYSREVRIYDKQIQLFEFWSNLIKEIESKPDFNFQKFNDKFDSYDLEKYVWQDSDSLGIKIKLTRDDFLKNWR